MRVDGPVWIESVPSEGMPFAGETIYIQFVSFDTGEADYEDPQHIADIMNVMLIRSDVEHFGEGPIDPETRFPTLRFTQWDEFPADVQESLVELHNFGDNTMVVSRIFVKEGDDIVPVVVE